MPSNFQNPPREASLNLNNKLSEIEMYILLRYFVKKKSSIFKYHYKPKYSTATICVHLQRVPRRHAVLCYYISALRPVWGLS